jgi:hypothetical protein
MILVNGCSFSAPSDENDSWVSGFYTKEFKEFKRGISNKIMQYDVVKNIAVGGSSNNIIRRKTFWYLNDDLCIQKPDYVIIQWSTIDRWDYPIFVDEEKAKSGFPRVNNHPERINKINYMCNGTDTMGYSKEFYEKYYSVYGAVIETLENIYHTQQYLEDAKVPYKMITIGNLFGMDATIEKLNYLQSVMDDTKGDYIQLKTKNILEKLEAYDDSWYELNLIKSLLKKIDFSKFLFTDNNNISGFGGGIIEWFLNKNETLTGGAHHPSGEQHTRFFNEFLWPKIENDIIDYKNKTKNISNGFI